MRFSLVTGVQTCALPIFELFPGQKLCDTGSASGNPLQDVSGLELAAPAFVENDLAKNSDLIVFVDRMDIVELTDGLDCLVVEFDFKDAHSAVGRIVNDFLDLAFKSGLVASSQWQQQSGCSDVPELLMVGRRLFRCMI